MTAFVLAAVLALASPAPGCSGPDMSVTGLRIKVLKGSAKTSTSDRVLITADLTNIGNEPQRAGVPQHAELLRNGVVVASQSFPPLASGVTYTLQFRLFRTVAERADPLEVLVRYVEDGKSAPTRSMNCSVANDSLQKIF